MKIPSAQQSLLCYTKWHAIETVHQILLTIPKFNAKQAQSAYTAIPANFIVTVTRFMRNILLVEFYQFN